MLRQALLKNGRQLVQTQARSFAIVTPPARIHFIDHPRHGKVYPVCTYDFSRARYSLPCVGFFGLTAVNSVVLYATMIHQIFTPVVAGFLSNPVFILPSLYLNYSMHQKYFIYFYGARSHV